MNREGRFARLRLTAQNVQERARDVFRAEPCSPAETALADCVQTLGALIEELAELAEREGDDES